MNDNQHNQATESSTEKPSKRRKPFRPIQTVAQIAHELGISKSEVRRRKHTGQITQEFE